MKNEPYKLDVKDMLAKGAVGNRESFEVNVHLNIELDEENVLKSYEGQIGLTLLEEESLAEFQISYTAETVCARCLKKFMRDGKVEFDRQYKLGKRVAEGDELIVEKDFQIEMRKPICEEIAFDIPMKPLCSEKCEGLAE
jgi:uncharacterized metal-binding protein YceD (DUF177 family)